MEARQAVLAALATRISKGNQTVGDGNGKVHPLGSGGVDKFGALD